MQVNGRVARKPDLFGQTLVDRCDAPQVPRLRMRQQSQPRPAILEGGDSVFTRGSACSMKSGTMPTPSPAHRVRVVPLFRQIGASA